MIVEDTYLIPYLQIKKITVKPFISKNRRLCFEVPDSSLEFINEFYQGSPNVDLSDYVARLKRVRSLLFTLRDKEENIRRD